MARIHRYATASATTAVAVFLLVGGSLQAQRATREQHTFATVIDKKNVPVQGLAATDLTVREDGQKREILNVQPAATPMHVVLLMDTSDSTRPLTQDLRAASKSFIDAVFTANSLNQMAIYTFGERPQKLSDFSQTPIPLLRAADGFFPAQGSGAYFTDAFQDVTRALTKVNAVRPVIVAFVNETGVEFSTSDHTHVADALQQSRAALWTVTMPDRQGADRGNGAADQAQARLERSRVINDLTVQSGGENVQILTRTAIPQAFDDVARLLASQYDITYARPESMVPPKKVDVATTRQDTKLLAAHWGGK
jgi:VWFA-related protein